MSDGASGGTGGGAAGNVGSTDTSTDQLGGIESQEFSMPQHDLTANSQKVSNFSMGTNMFGHGASNFGLGNRRTLSSPNSGLQDSGASPISSKNGTGNNNNNKYLNRNKRKDANKGQKASGQGNNQLNQNGYQGTNQYASNNPENIKKEQNSVENRIKQAKVKKKKEMAKTAVKTAAEAVGGPAAGAAAEAALKTPKGQKYLDAYAEADSEAEGINNVKKEFNKDRRRIAIITFVLTHVLPFLLLVILVVAVFKNADSQIFSNENGGTVQSENYIGDDKVVNIFANYPGLYEKIMEKVSSVSDKYQVELDKYLIIATLVAPISNELIVPVDDNSCGEENCYYFNGESKTWSEFLSAWADQTELLAKMQMLTYINNENEIVVDCGDAETMEQYAQNDLEEETKYAFWWLNPVRWFTGFRDAAGAEVNAKCVEAKNGDSEVPTVRVLSVDRGEYFYTNNAQGEYEYVKDPNSGGVYFWNLVNKNGFIHKYLKDYLSSEYSDDDDKNYEINKKVIVDTVNYIYAYYESIRKDCNGYQVIEGGLDKIDFKEDGSSPTYTLDFEDVFVGGSVLATYGGATGEIARAQAILTRSEAYNYIVEQGKSVIIGSAKMGCWWWKYNPTYDPSYENQEDNPNYDPDYPKNNYPEIYNAVQETKGLVVTKYGATKVEETEYDAFCPTTAWPMDGFYYLPDGQRNLPIEYAHFWKTSWPDCPCFQNEDARPSTEFEKSLSVLTKKEIGTPAQTTLEKCWTETGETKVVQKDSSGNVTTDPKKAVSQEIQYGYHYEPTGGHGRGVSQHGMAYFVQFGYDHEAVIKLFLERDWYGISLKRLEDTIEDGECSNYGIFNEDDYNNSNSNNGGSNGGSGGSGDPTDYGDSNYTSEIGGTALTTSLESALAAKGNTIQDLNDCIGDRVKSAGYGTRAGVVEAAMGLLECTMSLTGGYTYPYDHYGGSVSQSDLNGKLGVNSKWGKSGGTGCTTSNCLLGLNCASFVRWSFCNGGMDMCSRGSTFAQEQFSTTYYPEAIKIKLCPGFQVQAGSTSISSSSEAVSNIKPGDVLFSNTTNGGNGHVMVVVGVSDGSITIAENGRKTRSISKSELTGSSSHTYSVLLLDDYYANSNNVNSLSW